MEVIRIENLVKRYGSFEALRGISFKVSRGELHGFLGPNGAGKTTTIKILVGLLRADGGKAYLYGEEVSPKNYVIREKVGYMPELPKFPPWLTAHELLDMYGRMYGMRRGEREERIAEVLEFVGLKEHASRRISAYSKGMQQRLGMAQALLHNPDLLILDEPTAGMDPEGMHAIREMLKRLAEVGKTIFLSSHLLFEVQQICDHVTIINYGRILFSGELKKLIEKLQSKLVVRVEVKDLDANIVRAVEALKGVERVEVISSNTMKVVFEDRADRRDEVSRAVYESGGLILGMKVEEPSLEEAYLALVRGERSG